MNSEVFTRGLRLSLGAELQVDSEYARAGGVVAKIGRAIKLGRGRFTYSAQ